MKSSVIEANGIHLHVVETGVGKPVLFCHGFPDTWRGWRLQMEAVAEAGYRAIALDMRGYGRSFAPDDPLLYTQFHTVGDLVGLLNALELPEVTIVGHDFGANVAWHAAMMRPDRFTAVFGVSVPYLPRGDASLLDAMRAAGHNDFYIFSQIRPEADEEWSNAALTLPSMLYWTSGAAAPDERWDPLDKQRAMISRQAPVPIPPWANPDDMAYTVAEFQRTGFHGGLNYYRSIQAGFELLAPFKGVFVRQPSFFLVGETDGLNRLRLSTEEGLRAVLPGLRGFVKLPGVGHWPQREAPDAFNRALLGFLDEMR